ncbi:MAG: hypothetical protein F6J87_08745 [Spirulina sp. SIO3F2]|nr:hypothetical protein [Spirulina sp. SIO3F2]
MKSLTIVLAGCLSFSSITSPAQALDVPAACETLDPRELAYADPYRMSDRAIATAQEQYQSGQGEAAAQTLDTLLAYLRELDANTAEPAEQILGAYFQLQLAKAYIEIQHSEPAFILLESALEQSLESRYAIPFQIVSQAAELYARAGEFEQAWTLMNTPLPPGRAVDADWNDGQALVFLNTAQFHLDNHDLKQAEVAVESIDSEHRRYVEGKILLIEYLIAQGNLSHASDFAYSIGRSQSPTIKQRQRWSTLTRLSKAYVAAEQPHLARQTLDIVNSEMRGIINPFYVAVLLDIADVYIDLNDIDQAKDLLTQIQAQNEQRTFEEHLSDLQQEDYLPRREQYEFSLVWEHRYFVLLDVAKLYWRLGETERYQRILEDILKVDIVWGNRLVVADRNQNQWVAEFMIEIEEFELALEFLRFGDFYRPAKNILLVKIIEDFLAKEDYESALIAAHEIEDSEFYHWNRHDLIQELSFLGELVEQREYQQARESIESWNDRFSTVSFFEVKREYWLEFIDCYRSH